MGPNWPQVFLSTAKTLGLPPQTPLRYQTGDRTQQRSACSSAPKRTTRTTGPQPEKLVARPPPAWSGRGAANQTTLSPNSIWRQTEHPTPAVIISENSQGSRSEITVPMRPMSSAHLAETGTWASLVFLHEPLPPDLVQRTPPGRRMNSHTARCATRPATVVERVACVATPRRVGVGPKTCCGRPSNSPGPDWHQENWPRRECMVARRERELKPAVRVRTDTIRALRGDRNDQRETAAGPTQTSTEKGKS